MRTGVVLPAAVEWYAFMIDMSPQIERNINSKKCQTIERVTVFMKKNNTG